MFEYLMPRLLLRSLPGTLLAEAGQTAVARQIELGQQFGLPWGVSESSYGAQSPAAIITIRHSACRAWDSSRASRTTTSWRYYATLIASMVVPHKAVQNLRRLAKEGAEGTFGMYEAVDYTRDRLPAGERSIVVKSYWPTTKGWDSSRCKRFTGRRDAAAVPLASPRWPPWSCCCRNVCR